MKKERTIKRSSFPSVGSSCSLKIVGYLQNILFSLIALGMI